MDRVVSGWVPSQPVILKLNTIKIYGRVSQVIGLVVEGIGPSLGDRRYLSYREEKRSRTHAG